VAGEFDALVAVIRAWDVPASPAGTLGLPTVVEMSEA
jgi:hypothetical protein